MADQVISRANLKEIENSLSSLNKGLNVIHHQVDVVDDKLNNTKGDLEKLAAEFHEFVRQDTLIKNLQLAETRLVKIRQDLENKYGHYEEVRRRAIGILQAVDSKLIRKETIESASEEQLLAAPRYWLAPCLIALSAWLNDNKELAERAVIEALNRDDEKTSLFFALVARRGGRYQSSRAWLERYFGQQDPSELKREIVILIDGFSNGIFGPEARSKCGTLIKGWLTEFSQKAGFVESQRDSWKKALLARSKKMDSNKYKYLQTYSPTWPELQKSLEGATLYRNIFDYFNNLMSQEIIPSSSLVVAIDELLDVLVREFDEEELPLRRDERLNELIIKQDGDKNEASALFANERVIEERVSFPQMLTNFSMYAAESNASIATQKLSIALSKEWILDAHLDITAENRKNLPAQVQITLEKWEGITSDGSNEEALNASLQQHIAHEKAEALKANKLGGGSWMSLIAGIGFVYFGIGMPFLFIFAAICAFVFMYSIHSVKEKKKSIEQHYTELLENHKQVLLAVLSDVVDYRREYAIEDEQAEKIADFLAPITPEEYTYSTFDSARAVISSNP